MNTITITGILLIIVGLYAYVRGVVTGKPIVKRNTFLELGAMLVGVIGFYAFALGFFFILSQLQ